MTRLKSGIIQDTIDLLVSKGSSRDRQLAIQGPGAKLGFEPKITRFEARADETIRLVREITDVAAEQRR